MSQSTSSTVSDSMNSKFIGDLGLKEEISLEELMEQLKMMTFEMEGKNEQIMELLSEKKSNKQEQDLLKSKLEAEEAKSTQIFNELYGLREMKGETSRNERKTVEFCLELQQDLEESHDQMRRLLNKMNVLEKDLKKTKEENTVLKEKSRFRGDVRNDFDTIRCISLRVEQKNCSENELEELRYEMQSMQTKEKELMELNFELQKELRAAKKVNEEQSKRIKSLEEHNKRIEERLETKQTHMSRLAESLNLGQLF